MLTRLLCAGALLVLLTGCGSGGASGGSVVLAALDGEEPTPTTELTGLKVAGAQAELSWNAVEGADTYLVAVSTAGEPVPWLWSGSQTRVVYGALSPELDQFAAALDDEPAPPDPAPTGVMFTWTVIAFDPAGEPLAVSEPATFSCSPSCKE